MPTSNDFDAVFTRLKMLLVPFAPSLTVEADTDEPLLAELADLTHRGFDRFEADGML